MLIYADGLPRRSQLNARVAAPGFVTKTAPDDIFPGGQVPFYCVDFIIEGDGFLEIDGRHYAISAPAVFLQHPAWHLRYGPTTTWTELYLVYQADAGAALFERLGIEAAAVPTWPLLNTTRIMPLIHTLMDMIRTEISEGPADRLDSLCQQLITEALLLADDKPTTGPHNAVRAIRNHLELNPAIDPDYPELARSHGLSYSHFRRIWKDTYGDSPGVWLASLRMSKACRLLTQSHHSITDIAHQCGYADPLYFSRRFATLIGTSPSAYRASMHKVYLNPTGN